MDTTSYTRHLEAAKAALAAGFKSAAAQKEAVATVTRAFDEVRRAMNDALCAIPRENRTAAWEEFYFDSPDMHNWRAKHADAFVALVPAHAAIVTLLNEPMTLRAIIKAAPVVKPETKKAATERKVAAIKEAVAAGVASPIALAIAPLREEAATHARDWATRAAASAKETLTAASFDIDVAAPKPARSASKAERAIAAELRAHLFQFVRPWSASRTSYAWSEDGAQRFIANTVRETEASFDSFVLKLDGKVGAHTQADLVAGATWGYSILRVTLADGTVQRWKTQRITNCSSLGRLFNQWPTRIVK